MMGLIIGQGQAFAAQPLPFSTAPLLEGELITGISTSYLSSRSNFDHQGARIDLSGENSFRSVEASLFARYGLLPKLSLGLSLPYVMNEAVGRTTVASPPRSYATDSSGLGDARLEAQYEVLTTPARAYAEASVDVPFYSRLNDTAWGQYDPATSTPLGNGVVAGTLGVRLERELVRNTIGGVRLGYTYRNGGFSSLLPYETYMSYSTQRGVFLKLGLWGYTSLSADEYSGRVPPNLPAARSQVRLAGSNIYNTIDPSSLQAQGFLGTHLGKTVMLHGGLLYPLSGTNTPATPTFFAALALHIGGPERAPEFEHKEIKPLDEQTAARVLQVHNGLRQLLFARGISDKIKVGDIFDVYEPNLPDGGAGNLVARGRVLEIGRTRSKLQVLEFYKEIELQEGFVVRKPVR